MSVLLEARGVTRVFPAERWRDRVRGVPGVRAVDGVDLDLHAEQRLGLVGASGSGKTTLMRILLGLDRSDGGSVAYRGRPVVAGERAPWFRRAVQFVPQDPSTSLDPHVRVGDSVAEPLRCLRVPGDRRAVVAASLLAVGLDPELAERYPGQLSGGQRQRVAIARALAPGPEVVVADEAVSALDAAVRLHVLTTLREIADDRGLAMIFVSHDLGAVRHLCTDVAVFHAGRVVERGAVDAVLAAPTHPETARLVDAVLPLPEGAR